MVFLWGGHFVLEILSMLSTFDLANNVCSCLFGGFSFLVLDLSISWPVLGSYDLTYVGEGAPSSSIFEEDIEACVGWVVGALLKSASCLDTSL